MDVSLSGSYDDNDDDDDDDDYAWSEWTQALGVHMMMITRGVNGRKP